MVDRFVNKAKENIESATLLFQYEKFNASANRAYYSAFHAVLALMMSFGFSPAIDHKSALALFCNEFINKKKVFPSHIKKLLYDLQYSRNDADYGAGISKKIANNRLKNAQEIFELVIKELKSK